MKKYVIASVFVFAIVGVVVWYLIGSKMVVLEVTDKHRTRDISISVYRVKDDTLLVSGETDRTGRFQDTLKLKMDEEVRLHFRKMGFKVSPAEVIVKPKGKPPTINVTIAAVEVAKYVLFSVRNKLPNVEVVGINERGKRSSFRKTDNKGQLKTRIKKSTFKTVKFEYEFDGGTVIPSVTKRYNYADLPSKIDLKVIPDQNLNLYFFSVRELTGGGMDNVKISSSQVAEVAYTNSFGQATITVSPTPKEGPFIGDKLVWTGKKVNFKVFPEHETIISAGVFEYPIGAPQEIFTFQVTREFIILIRVLEEGLPITQAEIKINGVAYDTTDESGEVLYTYYDSDVKRECTIEVTKPGLSAKPQLITLGRVPPRVTLHAKTIHVFLKFLDSVTDDPIDGLTVRYDEREVGEAFPSGIVKVTVPQLADYDFVISDRTERYLEKRHRLTISHETIGKEFTVPVDPITGIRFQILNRMTSDPIENVVISRDDVKKESSNENGIFSEEFDPDPSKRYTYSFSMDNYLKKDTTVVRSPGRQDMVIELEELYAFVILKDDFGQPAPKVEVYLNDKLVDQTDREGEVGFVPQKIGEIYPFKFVSPHEEYVTKTYNYFFATQGQRQVFTVPKQPWIELRVFQPVEFAPPLPISDVIVTTSVGSGGQTDSAGVFKYKVLDKSKPVSFAFSKSGYEKITRMVVSKDVVTSEKVAIPRLQAFFYVYDSRTKKSVGNLEVSVSGKVATHTDEFTGRADILPDERPSTLELFITSPIDAYIPLSKTVQYTNANLGKFYIDPRPIKVDVNVMWAGSGLPATGAKLEIDHPYMSYTLIKRDNGRHTFEFYDRNLKPSLIITATTPSGQPFRRKVPITLPPDETIYETSFSEVLKPRPFLSVLVDPGVELSVLKETPAGFITIVDHHVGTFEGELPDFGPYWLIRWFATPDSTIELVDKMRHTIDLTRGDLCTKVENFFINGNWLMALDQVEKLTQNDECFCDKNEEAGKVSMDILNQYDITIQFLEKVAYNKQCPDQWKSPYVHLRMLKSYVELCLYDEGLIEAEEFDQLVQLLDPADKEETICNKQYLLAQLMYRKYFCLDDERRRATNPPIRTALRDRQREIRAKAIAYMERYSATSKECPSLDQELEVLKNHKL